MDTLEQDVHRAGYELIAGVDEAGRGPLAGPVVAASVIFPYPPPKNPWIRDSKTLTAKKRVSLVHDIYRGAVAIGVGVAWHEEIDRINILRAALKAMSASITSLGIRPGYVLIDGNQPIDVDIPQRPVVSGDSLSVTIAAASIIAKTLRDRVMDGYHRLYPHYNFLKNKGYGTAEHLAALERHGPCPIHRRSFGPVSSWVASAARR